uniref:Uncharacterized protein n=1 Tax=Gibberella zeae (strain ATCC MYA-4620 / CBS 123657 / FGSC 9075 / NRRL 31084 / PH-1) TaxID=229533 RepID=A0A098DY15_GIBZE
MLVSVSNEQTFSAAAPDKSLAKTIDQITSYNTKKKPMGQKSDISRCRGKRYGVCFTSHPNLLNRTSVTAAKSPRRLGAGWYLGSGGLLFEQTRRPGLSMNLSVVSHLLGTAVIPPWGCVSNSTVESTEKGNSLFCSNPKGAATLQSNVITQSSISPWLENGWSWYGSKDAVPTVLALQGYRLEGTQRKQKWAGGF